MDIDKKNVAFNVGAVATIIGVTLCAPHLGVFLFPFYLPGMKQIGDALLESIGGVATEAIWDLRGSLKPSNENEHLTRLLGQAYSKSIEEILELAELTEIYGEKSDYIKIILADIKVKIDEHLAANNSDELKKLFPTEENLLEIEINGRKKVPFYKRLFAKRTNEKEEIPNELLSRTISEDFILSLSDNSKNAERLVADEVEICLRRWFVQLNPNLAKKYSFPPSMEKLVFEEIGKRIPHKIHELVKLDENNASWIAFQRSHLQAILKQTSEKNNGLSADEHELLKNVGNVLDKLSKNDGLVKQLADSHLTIIGKLGETEENLKKCIAGENKKLEKFIEPLLGKIMATTKSTDKKVDVVIETLTKIVAPEKEGVEMNLVSLPDLSDNIYGRENEIAEILKFLSEEKKHGAIVLPTCFGKTFLIKKFLKTAIETPDVKSIYKHLFEKVIYIFCYENQTFEQLVKPFADILGKTLEYEQGNEAAFLKQEVFNKIQHKKILLIIDNFESWINNEHQYHNGDVRVFLETLLSSNHQIRTLFVTQRTPHKEKEFSIKTKEIKTIEDSMLEGLDENSALRFVRTEGNEDTFRFVEDSKLVKFFKKVHYIPQAIHSMLSFIDNEAIGFHDLMNDFWNVFKTAEENETELDKQIPKALRPTRALLKYQIGKLDRNSEYLLCLIAFFRGNVPEEILLEDFGNFKKDFLKQPLSRLVKDKLILRKTDDQPDYNEQNGDKFPIHYYNLHGFVKDIVSTIFPDFSERYEKELTNLADRMDNLQDKAWEKKLFDKQFALVECWEDLEQYLSKNNKSSLRESYSDSIGFSKALALQEKTFSNKNKLNAEEINKQIKIIEQLYKNKIKKYPKDANAHNNLGALLAEDESRQDESEAMFRTAIKLNPNYAKLHRNLGVLLTKDESRRDEAEAMFRTAIELNPNHAEVHNSLGWFLAKDESRRDEAEAMYRTAIELNPNYGYAYYNLGCLRSLSGKEENKEEAIEFLMKAIELNLMFKELAKTDSDFDFVRDDLRFKELVGD